MPPKGSVSPQKGKQPKTKTGSSSLKPGPSWVAPKAITHPEHHHTLNHLHQVASYYAILSASSSSSSSASDTACRLQGEIVRSAKSLSRKAVIRMDTGVKRASCTRCDAVWVEGLTVSVRSRVNGPHDHVVKWSCQCCGAVAKRPAPDLVPDVVGGETSTVLQKAARIEDRQDEPEPTKVSQRQRRRTSAIKRQLLQPTPTIDTESALPPGNDQASLADSSTTTTGQRNAKLSRRQIKHARAARLANRTSASAPPHQVAASRRSKKVAALTPAVAEAAVPAASSQTPDHASEPATELPTADQPLTNRRTPRPHLPHFNDRVQGSDWDDTFTTLQAAIHTHDAAHSTQALQYWQKAARSRGDHLLVTGVGRNGALGPSLP